MQSIDEAVRLYLSAKRRDKHHRHQGSSTVLVAALKRWHQANGLVQLENIKPKHIERFLENISDLRQNSQSMYIKHMRALFSWCVRSGIRPDNPLDNTPNIGMVKSNRKVKWCTAEQRDAMIAASEGDLTTVLILGFHCGMRYGEIIHAKGSWIEWFPGKGKLEMRSTEEFRLKVDCERIFRLDDVAYAHLSTLNREPDQYLVRPHTLAGGVYRVDMRRALKSLASKCGIPEFSAHMMRHTFVSLHYQGGTSVNYIAKWIGDTVDQVQKTYAHHNWDDDSINNHLRPSLTQDTQTLACP